MAFIVTAHRAGTGMADAYEDYLAKRKLAYVRAIPGVRSYTAYRRGNLFGPFGQAAPEPRFDIVAVIEVDDPKSFAEVTASPEFQSFRHEYAPWIEHQPGLYESRVIEQQAALTREEYWCGTWPELVKR